MKNLAETIFVFFILVLIAILSTSVKADNDDLAFDFVNAPVNEKVRKCYVFGNINTYQYEQVKYWPKGDIYSCDQIKEITKQPKQKISINECYNKGFYSKSIFTKVVNNEESHHFEAEYFYDLGDFCQQVHDELYPRDYDANKLIREIVK